MFLPIITAITLGGSFDWTEMKSRKQIFDPTPEQKMKIVNTHTQITYKLTESAADVNDFLDVEGELALKMKKSSFDGSASGMYLKKRVDRTMTVELLIHMNFENYTETFPSYIDEVPGWENNTYTGTHYVRSIVYGGELIVTYRINAKEASDLEDIRAAVKESLKASSGSVNQEFRGKLNKIDKTVKRWSEIDINAFYTGVSIVNDELYHIDDIFKLIEIYPRLLTTPIPIRIELESLNTLRPNLIKGQVTNRNVVNQILEEASDKYEDTTVAITKYKELSNLGLSAEDKEKRNLFCERVHAVCSALEDAINKLDMSKAFDPHIFDDAFAKYEEGGYNLPNRFTREINEFINKKNNYDQPWQYQSYSVGAVVEYTRWGIESCSLPSPEPLFVGFAMGAPKGFGSGSDVLCVPPDPDLLEEAATPKETAAIASLAYQTTGDKPETGTLICSRCELENATSVFTVPAAKRCPEGTKLEYRGFLATGTRTVTDPICIDGTPLKRHPEYKDFGAEDSPHVSCIKPVWMKCSGECRKTMNYVPCVVCSR